MWLANVRPSPGSAPNVHPRARPITDLRPNTRIIEILPRLNHRYTAIYSKADADA